MKRPYETTDKAGGNLRGWWEHLFLRRKLMSVEIKDHLLFVKVQQEANSVS